MTKIAIIEDDSVINQMYRMKFEADGFEVQVADNGKSGVAMAEKFGLTNDAEQFKAVLENN